MGNAESSGSSSPYAKVGYHVLLVSPGSPSADILFPFWDIIVGSQGQVFDKDDNKLVQLFQSHVGKPLSLHVYSLKNDRTREVTIVPNNNWGSGGLAGIHIRFCNFESILELVWHVLDVYVDSPAGEAQLVARTDYIIGIPERAFSDPEDFFNHINGHLRQPVQLFVYNAVTESVRIVTITPNSEWGGNGTLGCDIGYGYLHRIPTRPVTGQAPRASPAITASPAISASPISQPPTSAAPPLSPPPSTLPPPSVPTPPPATTTATPPPSRTVTPPPAIATPPPATPPPTTTPPTTAPPPTTTPPPTRTFTPPTTTPSATTPPPTRTFTPPPSTAATPPPSRTFTPPPNTFSPPVTPPTGLTPTPTPAPTPLHADPYSSIPTYTAPFAPLSAFPPPSAFTPPSAYASPSSPYTPLAPLSPYNPSTPFVPAPLPPYSSSSILPPPQTSLGSPLQKNSIMTPMNEGPESVGL